MRTVHRTPEVSFFARVQSELQTETSMAVGIQPASASRNAKGATEPISPAGQTARVDRSASGRLTAAAASVETASSSSTTLMETSNP